MRSAHLVPLPHVVYRLVVGSYPPKSAEDQLAIFLEHLAYGFQLSAFSHYNVAKSTARQCVRRVSKAIILHYQGFIRDPTPLEAQEWAEYNHEKFHMINCCAAMDGTHIALGNVEPSMHTALLNHKEGSYAILAHAVCSPQ